MNRDLYSARMVAHLKKTLGAHVVTHSGRRGDPAQATTIDLQVVDWNARKVVVTTGLGLVLLAGQVRRELAMVLPASWPLDEDALSMPEHRWPFAWLRYLGQTLPSSPAPAMAGDLIEIPTDPERSRPTPFAGVWLGSLRVLDDAPELDSFDFEGETVDVLFVCPVYDAEIRWARARGRDPDDGTALADLFPDTGVCPWLVDLERPLASDGT